MALTGYENLTPEFIAALMRGDYGDQTSMFADMRANPWVDERYGNPGNLSQDVLAQIAAGTSPDYFVGHGGSQAPDNSGNTEAQMVPSWVIGQKLSDPNWGTARWQTWDLGGNYLGYGSADSDLRRLAKAVAVALGGYYGGSAMSGEGAGAAGVGGGAGAGGGAGGAAGTSWADWAAAEQSGALAGSGYTGADFLAGEAAAGAGGAGAAGGTNWADWAANEGTNSLSGSGYTGSAFNAGEAAAAGAGGAGLTAAEKLAAEQAAQKAMQQGGNNGATDAATKGATKGLMDYFTTDGNVDYGKLAGGLLGAYAGYQNSKDQQQTQKTEPWGPAQPYLKGLLNEGAQLYDQYKQQPFSPAEQTAYSNYGNVLDFINHAAPALMSGFDATASGRNQFVRGQPRTLIGSSYTANGNPVAWQPGLLGSFGTTPIPKGAK